MAKSNVYAYECFHRNRACASAHARSYAGVSYPFEASGSRIGVCRIGIKMSSGKDKTFPEFYCYIKALRNQRRYITKKDSHLLSENIWFTISGNQFETEMRYDCS